MTGHPILRPGPLPGVSVAWVDLDTPPVPPRPDRGAAFFNGWTRKEAFVKALGQGLSFALDRFEVSLALEAEPRLLRVDPEAGPLSRWSLSAWQPEDGHKAALVVENR